MDAFLETRSYSSDFHVSAFYAEDNNFIAHWHMEIEMLLVLEGSIRIGVNKETRIVNKGEMVIINSTDIHYYNSSNLSSKIVVVIFRPETIKWQENLRFASSFIDNEILKSLDEDVYINITSAFCSIADEIMLHKPFFELYVNGKISEIIALALRYFPTDKNKSTKSKKALPDIERIQNVIKYLENNYNLDITLEQVSSIANLSPYYFSRLFKKFTGTNFKDYLNRVRVRNAQRLLKSTSKTITEISFECGFNSVRTFNRNFKAIKGYPPSKIGE